MKGHDELICKNISIVFEDCMSFSFLCNTLYFVDNKISFNVIIVLVWLYLVSRLWLKLMLSLHISYNCVILQQSPNFVSSTIIIILYSCNFSSHGICPQDKNTQ